MLYQSIIFFFSVILYWRLRPSGMQPSCSNFLIGIRGKVGFLSMLHSVCCHLTEFRRSGAGWGVATSIVLNGAFCFGINDDLGCSWSVFFSHSSFDSLPDRLLYNMFNEHDIVSSECSWQSWINMHHPRKDNDSFYSLHHERLPCT